MEGQLGIVMLDLINGGSGDGTRIWKEGGIVVVVVLTLASFRICTIKFFDGPIS